MAPRKATGAMDATRGAHVERTTVDVFGSTRTYNKHLLYTEEDERAYDRDRVPKQGPKKKNDARASLYEDPFAESELADMPEDEETIEQFRSDIHSNVFKSMIHNRREHAAGMNNDGDASKNASTYYTERDKHRAHIERTQVNGEYNDTTSTADVFMKLTHNDRRARDEIVNAMHRERSQHSFFDVDYARNVPQHFRKEFLLTQEVGCILWTLLPMLFAHKACTAQLHMHQSRLVNCMYDAGCELHDTSNHSVQGHLREHVKTVADPYSLYDERTLDTHAHYTPESDETRLRVFKFIIPTSAGADEDNENAGYKVHCVTHVVADDIVCFRTFYFTR